MAETAGRFENTTASEPEPFERGIHRADDRRRGVVGVQRGRPRRSELFRVEELLESLSLGFPFVVSFVEHLGESTPTDVTDERALFGFGGGSAFGFETFQQLDGREVRRALLAQGAFAQAVGFGDAEGGGFDDLRFRESENFRLTSGGGSLQPRQRDQAQRRRLSLQRRTPVRR